MRSLALAGTGFLLLICASTAVAQNTRVRSAGSLTGVPNVAHVADAGSAIEVHLRWIVADTANDQLVAADVPPANRFELIAQRTVIAGFVRERAPQLSRNHLVVVAVDAAGRDLAWQSVRDPRIVRAEIPDANFELSGQTFLRPVTELRVAIPARLPASAIRVFEVQPVDGQFMLREIGEIALEAR